MEIDFSDRRRDLLHLDLAEYGMISDTLAHATKPIETICAQDRQGCRPDFARDNLIRRHDLARSRPSLELQEETVFRSAA
ncbi:hypothetical protein [Jannaschia rubra]|nr:hypothetical protein [Jannaschia rubra]